MLQRTAAAKDSRARTSRRAPSPSLSSQVSAIVQPRANRSPAMLSRQEDADDLRETRARMAGHSGALDLQREERRRHGVAPQSRVWFTLSHGILNEIYYPRIDQACTRDFGFIVTDGRASSPRRSATRTAPSGRSPTACRPSPSPAPAPRGATGSTSWCSPIRAATSSCSASTSTRCAARSPSYRLYALLAPHLVNRGAGNTAWIDDYKGMPMLFAEGSGTALALGCSAPFLARSVGLRRRLRRLAGSVAAFRAALALRPCRATATSR